MIEMTVVHKAVRTLKNGIKANVVCYSDGTAEETIDVSAVKPTFEYQRKDKSWSFRQIGESEAIGVGADGVLCVHRGYKGEDQKDAITKVIFWSMAELESGTRCPKLQMDASDFAKIKACLVK